MSQKHLYISLNHSEKEIGEEEWQKLREPSESKSSSQVKHMYCPIVKNNDENKSREEQVLKIIWDFVI